MTIIGEWIAQKAGLRISEKKTEYIMLSKRDSGEPSLIIDNIC